MAEPITFGRPTVDLTDPTAVEQFLASVPWPPMGHGAACPVCAASVGHQWTSRDGTGFYPKQQHIDFHVAEARLWQRMARAVTRAADPRLTPGWQG